MLVIRKNDTVKLSDANSAKVLDIISTAAIKVYKIQKLKSNQIMYVEENLLRLEKQCRISYFIMFSYEAARFFLYVLNRLITF